MAFRTFNPRLKARARALRRDMTESEQRLWQGIRRKQILDTQFYRQRPIGPYIVDFYGASIGLVLEIDGSQHQENEHRERDRTRDAHLRGRGLYVLRFDSRQVLTETDSVLAVIREVVQDRLRRGNPPSVPPFSKGGRNGIGEDLSSGPPSSDKRRGDATSHTGPKSPLLKKGAGPGAGQTADGRRTAGKRRDNGVPHSKSPPLKKGG